MAQREIKGKIILRNDGSSEWGTANPVLSKGEIGIDTSGTPYKVKIGDGTSDWIALPYFEIEQQYVSGLTTALSDIEDGIAAANLKTDTVAGDLQDQVTQLQTQVEQLQAIAGRFTYVQI